MYRLLRIVSTISFFDQDLVIYRLGRAGSISNSIKPKNLFDMLSIIRESLEYEEDILKNNDIRAYELDNSVKLWFTVLGLCQQLSKRDRKEIIKELKLLSSIVDHALSRRTKIVKALYKVIGFDLTSNILSLYNLKFRMMTNRQTYKNE